MFLNLWGINRGHFCSTRFHQMRITVESRYLQLVGTSSKFPGSCNLVLISLKVACSVKTNATWTIKNTTSSHYFSEKFKTNTLQGLKRYIKTFELEIICLLKFSRKNDVISLKNTSFLELQVLTELIFLYNFQFSIFILQESSKWCLIFSYFSAVFEKWANLLCQELLFNHILKEC